MSSHSYRPLTSQEGVIIVDTEEVPGEQEPPSAEYLLWAVGPRQCPTDSIRGCHRKLDLHAITHVHVRLHLNFLLCARRCSRQEGEEKKKKTP